LFVVVSDDARTKSNRIYYKDLLKNQTLNNKQRNKDLNKRYKLSHLDKKDIYEKLCQGTNLKLDLYRASKLRCRYRHNNHPYLIWRPIKEDELFDVTN
jgi:hypothetical protein